MSNNKTIIAFKLYDQESIKSALLQYQNIVKEDRISIGNELGVLFVYEDNGVEKPLQVCHGNIKEFERIDKISTDAYMTGENDLKYTSCEGIFFSHALKYPELKEVIIDTAKEMVNYAKRHNDTWSMWADDMTVFGLDPLYLISRVYAEYTYLLGGFIVPYWDTEHAEYVFSYLVDIYEERGFDQHVMKAFCYSDNESTRSAFIGVNYYENSDNQFDLVKYFRENIDKYKQFKQMLKERYKDQDFLQLSENEATEYPIRLIYQTIAKSEILCSDNDYYDDDVLNAKMESIFIDDTYDNEAFKLQNEIEEYIGKPIAVVKAEEDENWVHDHYETWEDFFTNVTSQGDKLWIYILDGGDNEILNSVSKVVIREVCEAKELKILERIQYYVGEYDTVKSEFHNIFIGFLTRFYEIPEHDYIEKINGKDTSGRDLVIRAIDVCFCLTGKQSFTNEFMELIVESKVMSRAAFQDRYDSNAIGKISNIVNQIVNICEFDGDLIEIQRFMNTIAENRNIVLELVKGNGKTIIAHHNIECEQALYKEELNGFINKGFRAVPKDLTFIAKILFEDYKNNFADDLTKFLLDFLNENWIKTIVSIFQADGNDNSVNYSHEDLEYIRKFLNGATRPSNELMMKMMLTPSALNDQDKLLISKGTKETPVDEFTEFLKGKLSFEVKDDDPQMKYPIFHYLTDVNITSAMPFIYLCAFVIPFDKNKRLKEMIKVLANLAPIKTINLVNDIVKYIENGNNNFFEVRNKIGSLVPDEKYLVASEILYCLKYDEDKYIDMYIEDNEPKKTMFERIYSRTEIEVVLNLLPSRRKYSFYKEVGSKCPEILTRQADENIFEYLARDIGNSLKRVVKCKDEVQKIVNDIIVYVKGEKTLNELAYTIPKMINLKTGNYFTESLWSCSDEYRERIVALFITYGINAIDRAKSYEVDNNIEYVKLLLKLNANHSEIMIFIIDNRDESALEYVVNIIDIYECIKDLSQYFKEKVFDILDNNECHLAWVSKLKNDKSLIVRSKAEHFVMQLKNNK